MLGRLHNYLNDALTHFEWIKPNFQWVKRLIHNPDSVRDMVTRQDWLLMALCAAQDGRLTPIQTQKTLFIMKMEACHQVGHDFYEFVPYNYGPFNNKIYDDVQSLHSEGSVIVEYVPGRRWQEYCATQQGRDRAQSLRQSSPAETVNFLDRVVSWVKGQSFSDLLRAVYAKYPEYAKNSVFSG
jgi:uncharacterized protein YwgA